MFERFRKQSMRTRLTAFFVVMSIIPAAVLGVAALRLFSSNLEENEIRSNRHTLEFLDYRLGEMLSEIHEAVLLTAYDPNVRACFALDAAVGADTRAAVEQMAKRALTSLQLREDAQSVMLIGGDGRAYVYSKANFARVSEVENVDYEPLEESRFRIHAAWAKPRLAGQTPIIPYERVVLSPDGGAASARLVVNYREDVFSDLFTRYEQAGQARLFIVDLEGTVVSCADKALVGADARAALGLDVAALEGAGGSVHAEGFLCSYLRNASNGYVLVERMPLSAFSAMFRPVAMLLLGISVVCVFVCLALGVALSHAMTKPLYALISHVSNDPTSASHASVSRRGDEFAMLSDQYDVVIRRLEASIADYYEEQRQKKEAEVRALELQINPHFLYNTLSTIIWLIDAGESDRAIEITQDLSSLLRISISKGREFISLRDELCHVQLYVDIQKARYEDRISVAYDVPEALMDYSTPKLILQPLVENSILHGMKGNYGGCDIHIRGRLEAGDILLWVEDDGDRATAETIDGMNRFLRDRESAAADKDYGIGIANVHDRVRMFFGEDYGLRYAREDGRTIARIRIRAMRGGDGDVPRADR